MGIQHFYSQTVADGTATSVVRPSDWNSAHNQIVNLGGNTLGTSQVSGSDIVWAGGNGVTLSAAGSTVSVGIGTLAQSTHVHNFATTTTNGASIVVGTANSAGATIGVPAFLTTYAAQTNQTQASGNIAGAGYTSTTQAGSTLGVTHNSAGLSLAQPPFITTYAAQTTQTQPAGNIAGVGTTFSGTNVSATMGNNSNGLALSLSVAAPGGGGAINVAAGTTNGNVQTLSFANGNGVSFGLNGSTVTASAAGGGGSPAYTAFWWQPEVFGNTVLQTHTNGTLYIRPFEPSNYMDLDKYIFQQSMASSATTASVSGSVSAGNASSGTGTWGQSGTVLMFSRVNTNETNASYNSIVSFQSDSYSMSAGYSSSVSWSTNASSCTVSFTTSAAVGFIKSIDGAGGVTTGSSGQSGSSSFSSTSTNANSFSSSFAMSMPYAHMSGIRPVWVPGGFEIAPGEYWLGIIQSSNSGSTNDSRIVRNAIMVPSMLYFTASTNNYLEVGNSVAISTSNYRIGFGSHSASSLTTTQMGLSQISWMASNASLYFALDGKTL